MPVKIISLKQLLLFRGEGLFILQTKQSSVTCVHTGVLILRSMLISFAKYCRCRNSQFENGGLIYSINGSFYNHILRLFVKWLHQQTATNQIR